MVTQLIQEATIKKGNLAVLWLDLANAYGSIPYKLSQLTLTNQPVPSRARYLLADYYGNIRMRELSGEITSQAVNMLIKHVALSLIAG